jgi:hypothetical protein
MELLSAGDGARHNHHHCVFHLCHVSWAGEAALVTRGAGGTGGDEARCCCKILGIVAGISTRSVFMFKRD